MIERLFLPIFLNIFLGCVAAEAQVTDGSFTNGFTGWTLAGSPVVDSTNPPSGFADAALISSTNSLTQSNSVDYTTLESDLHVILPSTNDGNYAPVDGEAIYQQITLTAPGVLTFEYETPATDESTRDAVGYSLTNVADISSANPDPGTFTQLAASGSYVEVSSGIVAPGTYILGFVSYNTGDTHVDTDFEVSDISVPEPATWLMIASGLALLPLLGRWLRPAVVRP